MIQEKYESLLPFQCYTPFQKQCLKEIFNSGRSSIITTPLAIGEQFIPEFSIIKLLQTGLKYVIFYVFFNGSKSCTSEFFCSRYVFHSINVQKINKFADIESNEDWEMQTTIFIITFSDLINLLQEANEDFLMKISLIIFENITYFVSNSLDFETFIFFTRRYKYRVVGINYSFEIRDKLCKVFHVSDESKEILTYKGPKNSIINLISIQDTKNSLSDNLFLSEIKKYLPNQKIVIFCNAKTHVQNNVKLIETSFPSLIQKETVEKYLYDISDSHLKVHLSKGVGVLDYNLITQNKKVWQMFSDGIIKVLVVLFTSYLQLIQNQKEEKDISYYKIDVAFFRTSTLSFNNISFLTPDICNKVIIINDEKNLEKIKNCIQGNQEVKLSNESYLPRFILRLLLNGHLRTEKEIEDAYNNCFNNSFPLKDAFENLKSNFYIKYDSEQPEAENGDSIIKITDIGKIAENYDVDFNDINHFLICKPPKSWEELLAFLCTQTTTASKSIDFRDGDIQTLKLMLEDPKIPFKKSFIQYDSEKPEDQSSTTLDLKNTDLNENRSFTCGEKAYILILYRSFNNENFTDVDLVSDAFTAIRNISTLCSCFLAVSDLRHSYNGMCFSRELKKMLKYNILNTDSSDFLKQLPGIGSVYSAKLFDAGVKTYQDLLTLTPQRFKEILNRSAPKIAESLKSLPSYNCKYEIKINSDEKENSRNLIVTVENNGGSTKISKDSTEKKIYLICGTVNDDVVLYYDELQEQKEPIIINIALRDEIEIETLEFRVIDSELLGPDITMKIK